MHLYKEYVALMQKIADVGHATSVLHWDQEVYMPKNGAKYRGRQIATLSGIAHELFTADSTAELLQKLVDDKSLSEAEAKNATISLKDYKKQKKLPTEFVIEQSQIITEAYHAWIEARKNDNFEGYKPKLEKVVASKRKEAEYIGYADHPYDALLDTYEPNETTANLTELFQGVKEQLQPLLNSIQNAPQNEDAFMFKTYSKEKQWDFGIDLLKQMGYDFDGGRQDVSEHPFTTTFSADDVRVTTRVDENDLKNMLWSCIHEGGHALYEQGLPSEQYGLPLGSAISLGVHESQSRLWENNVGRMLPYWKHNFPRLQEIFPENLGKVSVEGFYKAMNLVKSSFIRTESDELTYHFHILIRFEIEKALIEGSLEVNDVKEAWNSKYLEYLNVEVPSDIKGIIQDIHWSHGSFGYFPTYSLGSFYAAQYYQKAKEDIINLETEIEQGNMKPLLEWLRTHIHCHGQFYSASELCEKVTGEKLNFNYFLQYAKAKYSAIYQLEEVPVS